MRSPLRARRGRVAVPPRGAVFAAAAGAALAACAPDIEGDPADADPQAVTWISPAPGVRVEVGDAVELVVSTANPEARSVTFDVDGAVVGVCAAEGSDCRMGTLWRVTTVFSAAGERRLLAWFRAADGTLVSAAHTVHVFAARRGPTPTPAPAPDPTVPAPAPRPAPDGGVPAGDAGASAPPRDAGTTARDAAAARDATPDTRPAAPPPPGSRGFLDPDRPYHSMFGGIAWAVRAQEVLPQPGRLVGSVSAAAGCMARYGASIRKWADRYNISRASVVATAITESNCTNPAGSSDGLSSGPMQVTGSTCAGVTGVPSATCKTRMHADPDFSFEVGVRYMASAYQLRQHEHDPPKIAAAYNAGSLRATTANRWHLVTTGNHIDRFVAAYNAYRAWERSNGVALTVEMEPLEMRFEGEHVERVDELPATAAEGQNVFVGDWESRDGEFYVFARGGWHRGGP